MLDPGPPSCLIHQSAWNRNSRKFNVDVWVWEAHPRPTSCAPPAPLATPPSHALSGAPEVHLKPRPGRGILRGPSTGLRPFYCRWPRSTHRLGARPSLRCNETGGEDEQPTRRPPPSRHQSTNLPTSKRALKALQRMLTTLNHQGVRLGRQSSGWGFPPPSAPVGLWHPQVRVFLGLRPL